MINMNTNISIAKSEESSESENNIEGNNLDNPG